MIHDYTQQLGNGVWTLWRVVRHTARQNGHAGPRRAVAVAVVAGRGGGDDGGGGQTQRHAHETSAATSVSKVHVDAHCVGRCCGGFEALYDSQACTSALHTLRRVAETRQRMKKKKVISSHFEPMYDA